MKRLVLLLGLLALVAAALPARAANTTARLLLTHESARPGETIWAGVALHMSPGWHTYWINGGDSGAPTTIDWTLPKGVTAGVIQWPVPEKLAAEGLITFVYHDDVVLLVPLTLATDLPAGTLDLSAKVSWLECEKLCIPGAGTVKAQLTVGEAKPSKDAALLATWKSKVPVPRPDLDVRADWEAPAKDDARPLIIAWQADARTKDADFFPFASDAFTVKPATTLLTNAAGAVRLRKSVEKGTGWPDQIAGVLIERGEGQKLLGAYEVRTPVAAVVKAAGQPAALGVENKKSLLTVLASAFLGGLILNLMPCVLPVLALKVFSFVQQSKESPGRVRVLGLTYAAGVLVSFLILAGVAIGIRASQGIVSWGQQFQSPQFLVVLTTLVTLMALNLFGVFEITLEGGAMSAASAAASKEGAGGAFFNGVLAVVLGTSCTAPFLGLAVGYALYQAPWVIVLTFLMVGAGLAFPYVALSFFPALRRFLPKPGTWMERFKVALGFPVLGTGVWLLSQMPTHFGKGGALWMGMFLLIVAVAAWVFGQFFQRGTQRRGLALGIAALLLLAGYGLALERELRWRAPAVFDEPGTLTKRNPDDIDWQPWSTAAVERARAGGRPVFVDFTADWCLNCQANKRTSIEIESVRKRLREINAVPLLGDFTRKNPAIAAELKRFDRAGVPLVLVYPKDAAKPPLVLPEILTPSIVLEALDQAAR